MECSKPMWKNGQWAQWWGRVTPPLVVHQLKTLLHVVLKFLFIVVKYFIEINYAMLQLRMQLKSSMQEWKYRKQIWDNY